MKPDEPPDPLVEGCGARDPGACAVPPPAVSPGTPVMLITTPEVGAMSVAWLSETWAATTCACAAATCAWPDASAFGLTWVCTARLSREEVICCDAELILDWPLIASMCCLLWSLANCALAWEQATEAGSMPQSLLTFAWSLATVAAAAAGCANTVSRAIRPLRITPIRPRPASQARVPVSQKRRRRGGNGLSVGACRIKPFPAR